MAVQIEVAASQHGEVDIEVSSGRWWLVAAIGGGKAIHQKAGRAWCESHGSVSSRREDSSESSAD